MFLSPPEVEAYLTLFNCFMSFLHTHTGSGQILTGGEQQNSTELVYLHRWALAEDLAWPVPGQAWKISAEDPPSPSLQALGFLLSTSHLSAGNV